MPDDRQQEQQSEDRPLSLYPMSPEEALRRALNTPPPDDDLEHEEHSED